MNIDKYDSNLLFQRYLEQIGESIDEHNSQIELFSNEEFRKIADKIADFDPILEYFNYEISIEVNKETLIIILFDKNKSINIRLTSEDFTEFIDRITLSFVNEVEYLKYKKDNSVNKL